MRRNDPDLTGGVGHEPDGGVAARQSVHRLVPVATALIEDDGRILHWSENAEDLLGYSEQEAVGSFAARLLQTGERCPGALALPDGVKPGHGGWSGVFAVRHRDGHHVDLDLCTYPILGPAGRTFVLATASDARARGQVEADLAVLDGLFTQSPIGLAVYDTGLRFVRINPALARINGLSPERHVGRRMSEVLPGINSAEMEEVMRHVLETGEPVVDARSHGVTPGDPGRGHAWSASYFRLEAPSGEVLGLSSSVVDITERFHAADQVERAQKRLALLAEATARIGTTLDLRQTARELAEAMAPGLADVVGVHVLEQLVGGTDPETDDAAGTVLVRRLAVVSTRGGFPLEQPPEEVYRIRSDSPYARAMRSGRTVTVPGKELPPLVKTPAGEDRMRAYFERETHPPQVTPLVARGTVLGVVVYTRYKDREPFDPQDITFGDELVSRAAVSIDNARLYFQEHATVLARQEALREANAAREHLALLNEASTRIGTTLDLTRTAEELVEVVLPRFADFATVDLLDSVVRGAEPARLRSDQHIRLCAVAAGEGYEAGLVMAADTVGEISEYDPAKFYARSLRAGRSILIPRVDEEALSTIVSSPDRVAPGLAAGIHSFLMVPVLARGELLGGVEFVRMRNPEPFTPADVVLAEEVVARAAVCIDNARLYRRERDTALTLQRSLLPQEIHRTLGLGIAYRYLPSSVVSEVGGDWFDVVPLSCGRVALVVGDVMGHGIRAAATMGQLRTVARTLMTLDMEPDEVLTRLDEAASGIGEGQFATCVCAVYDPVDRSCVIACAGHLPPVVVTPDGDTGLIDLPAGVPLGVGGVEFESVEVVLPEDGILALYTDGLVERRDQDIEDGINLLRRTLTGRGRNLEETCDAVIAALVSDDTEDDIAVIMAQVLPVPAGRIATLPLTDDATLAVRARRFTRDTLDAWGLHPLSDFAELLVSELVTNALLHAVAPRRLRLFHDRTLTVEVADSGNRAPRTRPVEGELGSGHGMRLVNQLAHRWGSRTTHHGKVVWFELELPIGTFSGPDV